MHVVCKLTTVPTQEYPNAYEHLAYEVTKRLLTFHVILLIVKYTIVIMCCLVGRH